MSNNIMVTAPASTGITAISKYAVINQVQTNIGIFISVMPGARIFRIVAMMLMLPMIDDAPMMCTAKIKNVTDGGAYVVLSGAYAVQPNPGAPPSINRVDANIKNAGGKSQKLKLFILGSAMSGAPIIMGISQLASPTKAGIIAPNTMTNPCSVVI